MDPEAQPYVGPRPFTRKDAPFFFGRDREANELRSLIISHSEVLLYAQSGAGKTSLINAKLSALLEDDDLEVLPTASVKGPQPTFKVANIYVFNTLASWRNKSDTSDDPAGMTLRKFLESRKPLLDEEGLPKPCVAIFDQFEELFTSHPECWEQRRDFFVQVRDALDALPHLRALFAMREDYVAAVDPYASIMPEKFRVRFHLENLRKDQAIEAIEGPLSRGQNVRHFGEGVAETLATELMKVQVKTASAQAEPITGEFVEPVQLQVVCQRLWRDLKPEDTEITLAHLKTISVEKALLSFYEESIRDVARSTEIDEATLRSWFEQKLVTPAGTRGMVFRGETQTEGMPNKAVDALDKLHVIRSELRGGAAQWYELTHDRFIDAIQKSREKLLQNLQAGAEETSKNLEARADEWLRLGEKRSGLLNGNDLHEAEHWLESPAAKVLRPSEKLKSFVAASRAEVQARSARRKIATLVMLGAACVIALVVVGIVWNQRQTQKAERQRRLADRLREESEVDRDIIFGRNLAASSLKFKDRKLDLTLLLSLEASRIADEINPKTRSQVEAKARLLAEAKGALLSGLVSSPHLRRFLHGHIKSVRSVAFSPDGKILASGGLDGKVILWDLDGFPLGPPLSGQEENMIYGVAFSPDGKKIASCGSDGNIVLRDIENPEKIIRSVPLGQGKLYNIAFSSKGNTIACGTESGIVSLYDIDRDSIRHLPKQHTGEVYSVAFSPKGNKLASAGQDKRIIFWNLDRGKSEGTLEDTNQVFSVAFSPDGKTLASGDMDRNVVLWDVEKQKRLEPDLKGHNNSVFSVAFSSDGKTLVSASTDKTIRRWNVVTRRPLGQPLTGSSEKVYSVAFHPNGKTIASGADFGATVLWDITDQPLLAQPISGDWLYRVALAPDGKTVALGDVYGNIAVGGETAETFKAHQKLVTSLAFNPDGKILASASMDGSIQLRSWNGKTWNSSPRWLSKNNKPINCIAFGQNNILASGGDDGVITFWDALAGTQVGTPLQQGGAVYSVAFSPDGKTLVSGSKGGTITLWDVAKREQLATLDGHNDDVFTVAFSPDGKILASGGKDTAVILWDIAARRPLAIPFYDHTAAVSKVAFSQDSKTLASCSYDKSIILWDVALREPIGPLVTEDQHDLFDVVFAPEGVLVSAGSGGLTYWDTNIESLRNKAGQVSARNLTPDDEWKRFLGDRPYRPTSPHASVQDADRLALAGNEDARKAFKEVVALAMNTKDATLDNEVGWYGTLDGFPEIVLTACDHAVQLAKEEIKPQCRDTRGVALAMTGKFAEAIKDFEATVVWLNDLERHELEAKTAAGQKNAAEYKKMREKREEWIEKLKSNSNPFDKSTLMSLRREGGASE